MGQKPLREVIGAYIQAFRDCFKGGLDPTEKLFYPMNQVVVENTINAFQTEICDCHEKIRMINKPYEQALSVKVWENTRVDSGDRRMLLMLSQRLDELGGQVARAIFLAQMFGFEVRDASGYGYSGYSKKPSIHSEVDKIVAEAEQE